MTEDKVNVTDKPVYQRLIALWVVCEAFAGGILHGFKIPFTGLGVSSLAIICIVLIRHFIPEKGSIMRATIIVAIFKLMLSPHAPPTAYIALFFQGLMGELLLHRKFFKTGAIILGILALVESAVQRILVLIIIYGNTFWKAVDQFVKKLTYSEISSFSLKLAAGYICIHAVTGFIVGLYSVKLAKKATQWQHNRSLIFHIEEDQPKLKKKRLKLKNYLLATWLVLLVLYLQQYVPGGFFILDENSASLILLRSLLIIIGWVAIISPLLMVYIRRKLENSKARYEQFNLKILHLIPRTWFIFKESWKRSAYEKKRWRSFFKLLLSNILDPGD